MTDFVIDFNMIPWETPVTGLRMKYKIIDNRKIRLAEFSKDFVENDWCLKGHIGYVLEGSIEVNIDGKPQLFKTKEGIFIPKGLRHKHIRTLETALLFLVEDDL